MNVAHFVMEPISLNIISQKALKKGSYREICLIQSTSFQSSGTSSDLNINYVTVKAGIHCLLMIDDLFLVYMQIVHAQTDLMLPFSH